MRLKSFVVAASLAAISWPCFSQSTTIVSDSIMDIKFLGTSEAIINLPQTGVDNSVIPNTVPNFANRADKSDNEDRSLGPDPLWKNGVKGIRQTTLKNSNATILQNWMGIGTNSNPPDPCLEVGPNHVVQMTNGSGGARLQVWNKNGQSLYGPTTLNSLWAQFGLNGLGDPIVLYDRLADRWFLSEFSSFGNRLMIAISVTNDPMGSYYAYEFQAPSFPDYPKYSVWPTGYFCTTNEGGGPAIYAMDRAAMLNGQNATAQRFNMPSLNAFGFQALTPVDFDGTALPAANSPALFFRHNDDEAHSPGNNNQAVDFVQYWELTVNWNNASQSSMQGPFNIPVSDFDSHLNGYTAFSGISQPGFQSLDPLREVFMNRMQYLNFGSYEVIVGAHLTDVNGNDRAGIRWYEFRRNGVGPWSLHQEGTYSPDAHNRWMSTISMDQAGNIAIAYAVSSSTVHPGLRFTGRLAGDPLGTMTLPEQTIVNGNGSNSSNRYGDYFAMVVDPSGDSTFWFTGQYNPSSTYAVRVAAFTLDDQCNGLAVNTDQIVQPTCEGDANGQITVSGSGGNSGNLFYNINGGNYSANNVFNNLAAGTYSIGVSDGAGCTFTLSNVSITEPAPISIVASPSDPVCNGEANGTILINANGGNGGYEYKLNAQAYTSSNTFSNLPAGSYNITVRDQKGCTETQQVSLANPPAFNTSLDLTSESAQGTADGSIEITATGGVPPYGYSLNGGPFGTSNIFSGLSQGGYNIQITDANGCIIEEQVELVLSSIRETFVGSDITLYPNPAKDIIAIQFEKWSNGAIHIDLYTIEGKRLKQLYIENPSVNWTQDFNLQHLPSGSYILKLRSGNHQDQLKFVKQ